MPEPYTPPGSNVAYTVPSLDDPADAPVAFRDFADSIPPIGGPALVISKKSADYTLVKDDMGGVVEFDTTAGDLKVTIPADANLNVPVGSVVVVSNVGNTRKKKVTITPAQGVVIKDSADRDIQQYSLVSLLKIDANFWLINAGTAGGTGPNVPLPPTITLCSGAPDGAFISWTKPADDGGSTITSYVVEQSLNQTDWTQAAIVAATLFSASIYGLTAGTTYYFRVKASNSVGFSEPSEVANAVPTSSYNDATGGTETQYSKDGKFFRVHTFVNDGTLTVKNATSPFRVLVVAGGGGGGGRAGNNAQGIIGGSGGAGGALEQFLQIPSGENTVLVGAGGNGGDNNRGGKGGDSSVAGLVATGGGGGGASYQGPDGAWNGGDGGSGGGGQCASQYGARGSGGAGIAGQGSNGATGGEQGQGPAAGGGRYLTTDITGTSMTVSPGSYGSGGSGTGWDRAGDAGAKGVVIVSYEVAPFNDAVGGDETVVENYNGTGQKWKIHVFKNSAELIIRSASQPFRVLCVAGGGGGGGGGPYAGGGGGGGAGGLLFKEEMNLAVGTFPVTIGQGGAGGSGAIQGQHNGIAGRPGGNSSFATLESFGGGGGEAYQEGGSGGGSGGGSYSGNDRNYPGTPGQGNNGGPGAPGPNAGPGGTGGGAAASGASGGAGKDINITGQVVRYASGGGCADTGGDAAPNTGNGGLGDRYGGPERGGNGGSGAVIVAYQIG